MTSASADNHSESDSPSTSSKRYTLLELQYDGTDYFGWQVQPGLKTIQGKLLEALTQISGGKPATCIGSGRTDTGVHAIAQFAKVTWENDMDHDKIVKSLNGTLPSDIRVVSSRDCAYDFHPVRDAHSKIYRYYFSECRVAPVMARFVYQERFPLDMKRMIDAASVFVGEYDFQNFRTMGTPVNSTVRKIFRSEVRLATELSYDPQSPIWVYEVEGEGFLKQMVRLMVSALLAVGKERVSEEQIKEALSKPMEKRLSSVAPPQGLVLYQVNYKAL